ncbi:SH3 domain-binding protein 2-like [Haliotis cracherodii]|uniref:SH3 domain-binding protein 2-like n=1 Tax=Haliotis cracherodii TaxID=6455 RepID=UPI0039E7B2A3
MTSPRAMEGDIIPEPYTGLGAQPLLQHHPPRHTGFLRKRGKRERMLESFRLTRSLLGRVLRWRQRFVVISQGCIYCFASETAGRPLQAFTLKGYNRLLAMDEEPSTPWAFRISSPDETAKVHYFSCVSDVDRMTWMKAFREEMMLANKVKDDRFSAGSVASTSSSKDVYVMLHKPIFEPPQSDDSDEDSDEEEDDSDYDQINDLDLEKARRPRIPLPPTPDDPAYKEVTKEVRKAPEKKPLPTPHKPNSEKHTYINSPKHTSTKTNSLPAQASTLAAKSAAPRAKAKSEAKQTPQPPKPKTKPKPTSPSVPSEKEYFFPESDRDKALSILREQNDQGTYLVRMSRTNDQKVLSVMTEGAVIKEYKILQKEKKVTINNRDYYKSVGDLLVAYQARPLPNRTTSLGRAYSSTDLRP